MKPLTDLEKQTLAAMEEKKSQKRVKDHIVNSLGDLENPEFAHEPTVLKDAKPGSYNMAEPRSWFLNRESMPLHEFVSRLKALAMEIPKQYIKTATINVTADREVEVRFDIPE